MCGLLGVLVGVRRPAAASSSVLAGVLAMATFLAYAGAWPLAGAVCLIHVIDATSTRDAVRRGVLTLAGVVVVAATMVLAYRVAGESWVGRLRAFSSTITQGEFSEGWSLPFAYLWHAEHLLMVGWLAAAAWGLGHVRWAAQARLPRAGLAGAISVYGALAIASTLLQRFVVYGRLARPLVPFLCLTAAGVLGLLIRRLPGPQRRAAIALSALAIVVQAALNFRDPLRQVFPAEFVARVTREYPGPRVFVNARHLYPGPEPVEAPAGYREIASERHPLEFLPYQYEGYTAGERRVLRAADIRMRAFVPAH